MFDDIDESRLAPPLTDSDIDGINEISDGFRVDDNDADDESSSIDFVHTTVERLLFAVAVALVGVTYMRKVKRQKSIK